MNKKLDDELPDWWTFPSKVPVRKYARKSLDKYLKEKKKRD